MPTINLIRREIDALPPPSGVAKTYYDTKLRGFGLRFHSSGAASWIVEYRAGARGRGVDKKRIVIGHPDTLSPDAARKAAKNLLARIELGADPAADRSKARRADTWRNWCVPTSTKRLRANASRERSNSTKAF